MTEKLRKTNGAIAIALLVFFFGHALLGAFFEVPGGVALVLIWLAVLVAMVHVALCVMTSSAMLKDEARPPSPRKKAHLALKWVSGLVLFVAAAVHCQALNGAGALLGALLAGALAWHGWVGAKSAASDLNVSSCAVVPLRATICIVLALLLIALAIR